MGRLIITETSKKISLVGGSLRDIQMMAVHSSLQTTQRYIDGDSESQRKVVDLIWAWKPFGDYNKNYVRHNYYNSSKEDSSRYNVPQEFKLGSE
jgi:hypothetical protein